MLAWYPLLVLAIGLAIVMGGIVFCRINAFLSLITAAMVVSLLSPGEASEKIVRVAEAFGSTTASVGLVIALAAVIGRAMRDSGAADRIVASALAAVGEGRGALALTASSFVLAIPVFFDTVFYLLVPLARSMYRRTGGHYVKYLLATASCVAAHALVPPTPGPLLVASTLGVDVGLMMLIGFCVAVPAAAAGLAYAAWADRHLTLTLTEPTDESPQEKLPDPSSLPSFAMSIAPVLVPIVLISTNTFTGMLGGKDGIAAQVLPIIGNPNFALLLAAAIALITYWQQRKPSASDFSHVVEEALMSGGMIILITAAGGAFGAMLKEAQLAMAIESLAGELMASGYALLFLSFGMASLIKFAQGSSTAAMIVTSAMIAAMVDPASLSFSPVGLLLKTCSRCYEGLNRP